MAERATDLRDIERRVVAHLVGEPEPGRPAARRAGRSCSPRTSRPSDTATLDPTRGRSRWSPSAAARPATPRSSPASSASPAWSAPPGVMTLEAGTPLLVDGTAGTVERRPTPTRPRALVEADRAQREALESWTGPGETADGTRVKLLANVADGESARAAADRAGRGRRAVPHRAVLPQPRRRAVRGGAGLDLRRGARAVRRAATSSSAPSTRAPTSRSPSRPTRARRTPPSASAGCGSPSTTPACSTRQLDGIAGAAARDRHRDLGDGADGGHGRRGRRLRRRGARARPQARA